MHTASRLLLRRPPTRLALRPPTSRVHRVHRVTSSSATPLTVVRHTPPPALVDALRGAGFTVKTVTLPPGHVLSGHAHALPRKRLAVAAGGRFVIAAGDATPAAGVEPAAVLETGDFVDIPAGWRHSAWVDGGVAVTLLVGDG